MPDDTTPHGREAAAPDDAARGEAALDDAPGRQRHRAFAPTVLLGLVGAGLAAVASTRAWAAVRGDAAGLQVEASVTGADSRPLVAALSLVALASWGAVLVLRGRGRRVVAGLGLLASAGVVIATLTGISAVRADAVAAAVAQGARSGSATTMLTAWLPLTVLGGAVALASLAVAVRQAPRWPAMGSRYDAPATRGQAPEAEEDMWRALDAGRDPTS
jgi:uncharacterized membrane protein (TIGR02234 family)